MKIVTKVYERLPAFLKPSAKKTFKKSKLYVNPNKKPRKVLLEMIPKNSVCAEIGVQQGYFSMQILKTVQPKKLFLIDNWAVQPHKSLVQSRHNEFYQITKNRMKDRSNVQIIKGLSHEVLTQFPDNYFDWVYIDGDHRYEFVLKDLEISYKKVKTNGLISGDDYDEFGGREGLWVFQAVTDFIKSYPVESIMLGKEHQFVLRKLR